MKNLLLLLISSIGLTVAQAADNNPPTLADTLPPAGAVVRELTLVDVIFSESVTNVQAGDLLANGVAATNVAWVSPREYVFYFPQPPDGEVKFGFAANHGIVDYDEPPKAFAGATWTNRLDSTQPPALVVISELMADNTAGIKDEDGDREDWIELLNRGTEAVNLEGWFLSDESTNIAKWRFPAITIAPNGYLLVWASEKNRSTPTNQLHTNFKLGRSGEFLALADAWTNIVSAFLPTFGAQQSNISFGRDKIDPNLTGYFQTPTPSNANVVGGSGFAPTPVISLKGGVFTDSSLTVGISAPSGEIRYTLNGSIPTVASTLYTNQPLVISNNTVLQARTFETGLLPSAVALETYTFLSGTITNFVSNLPVLVINTAGRTIGADVNYTNRTRATMAIFEPRDGATRLQHQPDYETMTGMELRGQTSAGFPKIPYNVEIQDVLGNDMEVSILGLPPESDFALHNPYSDKCQMNNYLTFELNRKMGHWAPGCVFVEVFIKSSTGRLSYPADYRGLYVLMEKIKIDKSRVDIERMSPFDAAEPDITGGYIFKKDKDSTGDLNFSTVGGSGFSAQALKYHEPKPREITVAQRNWLRNYLVSFERALYATNWLSLTGTNHYSAFVDQDSFVDYTFIVEFAKQIDGYRLSNYMSKDRGGKVKMEPIWDWNLAWGNADYLNGFRTNGWYWADEGGGMNNPEHIWMRRMIMGTPTVGTGASRGDPDFIQKLVDRWCELRTNVFETNHVIGRINEIAAYLTNSGAAARDFAKYPRLGTYVWPNPPMYSTTNRTYEGIIKAMANWTWGRYLWMDSQYGRPPEYSSPGGRISPGFQLTITAPAGTIYYTLDGTDPRLSGGVVNPQAQTYNGPITLNGNARIVARSLVTSNFNATVVTNKWSGPAAATFVVSTPALAVTEIMYNPEPGPLGSTNAAEDFAFIEIRNTGQQTINLPGARIRGGIDYTFTTNSGVTSLAPGAFVFVVKNTNAFAARYPNVNNVAGQYSDNLDNNSDRIVLEGPMREPIAAFAYRDHWHPATDGLGFSLVLVNENNPEQNFNQETTWRASSRIGGSPGQTDPAAPQIPVVYVNEVLSDPLAGQRDAIELYNPSNVAANIGGWFLSDDLDTPKKYRIQAGTTIPANGYLVLDETHFNSGAPGSFAFGDRGDDAYIFSGDGVNLTGYAHGFSFGAAAPGVSFGRHVNSRGQDFLVRQRQNTLGAANAGPAIGPVVMTEIMFHPPALGTTNNIREEFIELRNLTSQEVKLFEPTSPNTTWRLEGSGLFDFPPNAVIPANGVALIVKFNPQLEPLTLAAFRQKFNIGANIPVFGPYRAELQDNGETLSLYRTGTPEFDPDTQQTVIPYLLADQFQFEPVPEAAGTGASLQRRSADQFGNDAGNWFAAAATAGTSSQLAIDSVKVEGGSVRISFRVPAGKAISVFYRDSLTSGDWVKLTDLPAQETERAADVTDALNKPMRFYRLVAP